MTDPRLARLRAAPLEVKVGDGQLVISIGIDTLVWALRHGDDFLKYDEERNVYLGYRVTDAVGFAKDVAHVLDREDEVGTTPIHLLFDRAMDSAINDGSVAVAEEREVIEDV
jgi:hypothetical protein